MPIYKANGKTYDIPEEKVSSFETAYPDATVDVYDGDTGKGYEIPVSKVSKFKERYPKWSYGKAENSDGSTHATDVLPVSEPEAEKTTTTVEKDDEWKPTPIQKALMIGGIQTSMTRFDAKVDEGKRHLEEMAQYTNSGVAMTGGQVRDVGVAIDTDTGEVVKRYQTPTGRVTTDSIAAEREASAYREVTGGLRRKQDVDKMLDEHIADATRRRSEKFESTNKDAFARKDGEGFWNYFFRVLGNNPNTQTAAVTRGVSLYDDSRADEETNYVNAELRILEEAKRLREAQKLKKGDGFWDFQNIVNFGQGVKDVVRDVDTYAGGTRGLHKTLQVLDLKEKAERGEELSEKDMKLAEALFIQQGVESSGDTPHGYNAGRTTAEMGRFMVQMAMNPTSGLGKAIATKAVKKFGEKGAKAWAAKIVGTVAGDLGSSLFLANTLQMPTTLTDIGDRQIGEVLIDEDGIGFVGGDGLGKSIFKGEASAVIENYTEMLGEHFGAIGNAVNRTLGTGIRKIGGGRLLDSVSELTTKIGSTKWAQGIANIERRAQWNGPVGEMLEEEAGIILNSVITGDNSLSDLVDVDQQIDIALGVGLFGGFVSGIKTIGYPIGRYRRNQAVKRADVRGSELLGEDWKAIRESLDGASESELPGIVKEVISKPQRTPEQRKAVLEYVISQSNARGYNQANASERRDRDGSVETQVENAFDYGYDISEPQEMNDAKRRLDFQRQRLASSLSEDAIAEFDEGPIKALEKWSYDHSLHEPMTDYVNAKMVYDGMIQRVRDDVDGRIAQSDAMIDSRVNRGTGMVQPATMKIGDRKVYIVSGTVSMYEDGTGVDAKNSSESIIIRDAETRKVEFADPTQFLGIDEAIDAETEKEAARKQIIDEIAVTAANNIDGVLSFTPGDSYSILDAEGNQQPITILGNSVDEEGLPVDWSVDIQYPDGTIQSVVTSELQQLVDAASTQRVEQFDNERSMQRDAEAEAALQADQSGLSNPNRRTDLMPDDYKMPYDNRPVRASRYIESENGTGGTLYQDENGNDAIVIAAIDDNNYVGYFREYDEQGNPTNRWSAKFQNGSGLRQNHRDMMLTAQELLPAGHELTEHTSVSTDGLRNLANQLKHGYELQYDEQGNVITDRVAVNMMARENDLGLLNYNPGSEELASASYRDEAHRADINARLAQYLAPLGLGEEAITWEDGTLYVNHPILRRADTPQQEAQPTVPENAETVLNSAESTEIPTENRDLGTETVPKTEIISPAVDELKVPVENVQQAADDGFIPIDPEIKPDENGVINIPSPGTAEVDAMLAPEESKPTALSQVPTDQNGEPIYEQAEPDTAWDALVEQTEGDEDIAMEVAADVVAEKEKEYKAAEKALKKAIEGKPETAKGDGVPTMAERIAAKKASKAAIVKARGDMEKTRSILEHWQLIAGTRQRRIDAEKNAELQEQQQWEEAKSRMDKRVRETSEKYRDLPEVLNILEQTDPQSIDEVAAWVLSRYKVLWNSRRNEDTGNVVRAGARQHTGIGEGERRKLFGLFASEANGGRSIENLAEDVFEEACNLFGVAYDNAQALDALIDVIKGATSRSDITNYIVNNRIAQAESEGDALHRYYEETEATDREYHERYGMAEAEWMEFYASHGTEIELTDDVFKELMSNLDGFKADEEYERGQIQESAADTTRRGREESVYTEGIGVGSERWLDDNGDAAHRETERGAAGSELVPDSIDEGSREENEITESTTESVIQAEEDSLRSRVEVKDDDWTEGEGYTPTLKRTVVIDGSHNVTQIDAPNAKGDYTGSVFEYDGNTFGDLREVIDYIDNPQPITTGERIAEAEAEVNISPTDKQKEAGNYKKGHVQVGTFDVTIENPKGSKRSGTDADGKKWESTMTHTYGYIRGTKGVDGDHIDVYISSDVDGWNGRKVFVVDQYNPDGSFDEHKVMLGFNDKDEAFEAYLSNYEAGWENGRRLDVTAVNLEDFEKWIDSSKRKTKAFADYKSVKSNEDNSIVGRSLSEQEASDLIARMEMSAEKDPKITLSPESWQNTFGLHNSIATPLGEVKMGEGQYQKFVNKKRSAEFGMAVMTLEDPDLILIEPSEAKDGHDSARPFSYVFVKTFIRDGQKIKYYTSVSVLIDGMEVSVSSHFANKTAIQKKLQEMERAYTKESLLPNSSEWHLAEHPTDVPDLLPTQEKSETSDDKDNTLSSDKQTDDGIRVAKTEVDTGSTEAHNADIDEHSSIEDKLTEFALRFKDAGIKIEREMSTWISGQTAESLVAVDVNMLNRACDAAGLDNGNARAFRMMIDRTIPKDLLSEVWRLRNINGRNGKDITEPEQSSTPLKGVDRSCVYKSFLSEREYIDRKVEDAFINRKDKTQTREEWEDDDDYIPTYNRITDSYPDYISGLKDRGELQRMYDAANIGERIKIRKGVEDAGFDVHDMIDFEKERQQSKRKREKRKAERTKEIMKKIGIDTDGTESDTPVFSIDGDKERNQEAYNVAKGLVENTGIEVVEVSGEEAQAILEHNGNDALFHIRTYHGTGAEFDRFDFRHMGSGEGAQAFGWGGYVTEVKGIGKSYATAIGGKELLPKIKKVTGNISQVRQWLHENENYNKYVRRGSKHLKELKREYKNAEKTGDEKDMEFYRGLIELQEQSLVEENHAALISDKYGQLSDYQQELDRLNAQLVQRRHLYTVRIPDDIGNNYLDWDGVIQDEIKKKIVLQATLEGISFDFYGDTVTVAEYFSKMGDGVVGYQLYRALIRSLGSDRMASELLSRAGLTGVKYAADRNNGGRADKKKNYVIFNEGDMKIANHVQFMKDMKGDVYGWTIGSKIYLNRDAINPETPLHEYTHLWDEMVRKENPELWNRGKELLRQTPMWDDVVNDPNYADIAIDEDAVASEVHARITGKDGARLLEEMIEKAKESGAMSTAEAVTVAESLKRWLTEMFNALKATLDRWSKGALEGLTIEDFNNLTLRDLAEGMNPNDGELSETRFHAAMSRGGSDFYALRDRAVAERGIVMPGLRESQVDIVEIPRHNFTGTGKQAIEKARVWATSNLVGEHWYHKGGNDGFRYQIDEEAIGKYLSSSSTKGSDNLGIHLACLKRLSAIIDNSVEAEIHADYAKTNGKRAIENGVQHSDILIHRYYGAVRIEGKLYRVKTTIKETLKREITPYNYQVTELELLISGSETSDALSNSNRLDGTKLLKGVEKSYDAGVKLLEASERVSMQGADEVAVQGQNSREDEQSEIEDIPEETEDEDNDTRYRIDDLDERVAEYKSEYNSTDIVIIEGTEDIEALNLPVDVTADLKECCTNENIAGVYCEVDKKIYIFANNESGVDIKDVLIHENIHAIIDSNDEGMNEFLDNFMNELSKSTYSSNVMHHMLELVMDNYPPEEVPNEYLAYMIQYSESNPKLRKAISDSLKTETLEYLNKNILDRLYGEDHRERRKEERDSRARREEISQDNGIDGKLDKAEGETRYRQKGTVGDKIENLFTEAITGNLKGKPVEIGRLTGEGREYLEKLSGLSFKEKVSFVLNPSDLMHIYKNHFGKNEKDKGQNIPLDIRDIRNLAGVISNPDKVIYLKEGNGLHRNMFYFFKEAENGTYNLMEIYSDRKGNLTAKTFYKTRKDATQRAMDIKKSLLPTSGTYFGAILSADAKLPQFFELSADGDVESLERDGHGAYSDAEVSIENDPWSKAWGESIRTKRQQKQFAERERKRMHERVEALSSVLGIDIEVIEDASTLKGKKQRAKGWYDTKTGKITVVVSNHNSVSDMEATILHEAVAHHGLRQLLGEHFDEFLDKVYEAAEDGIKERIDLLASRNGWNRRVATEEYLAGLAEKTDFSDRLTEWFTKVKSYFVDMLRKVGFKHLSPGSIGDNELRYILWRSYQNLANPGRYRAFEWEAEDVALKYSLGLPTGYREIENKEIRGVADSDGLYELNNRFNEELEMYENGELPDTHRFELGMPSAYLKNAGFPMLPISMRVSLLSKKSALSRHPFEASDLNNLVHAIRKPIAIFKYTKDNMRNLIVDVERNGKQFLVGVTLNYKANGIEINSVSGLFPKDSIEWLKWIQDGKAIRIDEKNKVREIINSQRTTNTVESERIGLNLDEVTKIVENFENPAINEQNNNVEGDNDVRFRDGYMPTIAGSIASEEYERAVMSTLKNNFDEAWHDYLRSVKALQDAVAKERGKGIDDTENVYEHALNKSSVDRAELDKAERDVAAPLIATVKRILKENRDLSLLDVERYMNCKHAPERNETIAQKKAKEEESRTKGKTSYADAYRKFREEDYSGLSALFDPEDTGKSRVELEKEAEDAVKNFEGIVGKGVTDELWSRMNRLTSAALEKQYVSGLLGEGQYKELKDRWDYYVPLRGFREGTAGDLYEYVNGDALPGLPVERVAGGRKSEAGDIIGTSLSMLNRSIVGGNKNVMKQKLLNLAMKGETELLSVSNQWYEQHADGTWSAVYPDIRETMSPVEVRKEIEDFDRRMELGSKAGSAKRGKAGLELPLRNGSRSQTEQHGVKVSRNGVEYVVWVNGNPKAAQAINGLLNPDSSNTILDFVEKINRMIARNVTSMRPNFLVRNLQRDIQNATVIMSSRNGADYARRMLKNVKNMFSPVVVKGGNKGEKESIISLYIRYFNDSLDLTKQTDRLFDEFMRHGGETGYSQLLQPKEFQRKIEKEIEGKDAVSRGVSASFHAIEQANRCIENVVRFAAYRTSRESGKSILQSIGDAKEASVNFNRKGSGAMGNKLARSLYIFVNPAVQGVYQYLGEVVRNPRVMLPWIAWHVTLGALMPLVGTLLYNLYGGGDDDDDGYFGLQPYLRRGNVCIPVGNEKWLSVPMSQEQSMFYGIGETLSTHLLYGKGGREQLASALITELSKIQPMNLIDGKMTDFTSDENLAGIVGRNMLPTGLGYIADAFVWDEDFTGRKISRSNDFNSHLPEWRKGHDDDLLLPLSRYMNDLTDFDGDGKGLINFNPSRWGYVLSKPLGGLVETPVQLTQSVLAIWDEDYRNMRNYPIVSSVIKDGGSYHNRNRMLIEEVKWWEAHKKVVDSRVKDSRKDGIFENAEVIDRLFTSGELNQLEYLKRKDKTYGKQPLSVIKDLNKTRWEAIMTKDRNKQSEVEGVLESYQRGLVERLREYEEMSEGEKLRELQGRYN